MATTSWQRSWEYAAAAGRRLVRAAPICLVAGWMLFAHHEADAQQFTFRHYQQMQGLGNLSVTCLLQDREGYIWVCTENGLYRYDGVDFERIGEMQGIDNSTIRAVLEDSSGRLWVGTSQDLYRSDGLKFRPIRPEGRRLRLAAGLRIAALSPERLLVIDNDELLELNYPAVDGHWQSRPFFPQSLIDAIPALAHLSSVHVDRMDRIWLGCGSAICRVEQGAVRTFDANSGVPDDIWRSWVLDRDGRLWARGAAHVVVLEAGATRFDIRDPPHARLTAEILNVPLAQDPQGRILTTTDVGLSRWQGGWQDYSAMNGIPATGISAILSSRDGQVWLGLPGRGIARWLGYGHFESWTMAQGLRANAVWSILPAADHSILLATRAGCSRLDPTTSVAAPCPFGSLPPGEIRVMAQRGDVLWVGLTTGGLFRIVTADHADHNVTWVANVPTMRKLFVDSADQLWIGTTHGVAVVAPGSMQVDFLRLPTPVGEVADITQDAHGAIWLATQGGLLRWSDGRWSALGVDGEHAGAGFTTVAAAGGDWLWAGGVAHGLLHLHIAGNRVDETKWVADLMLARAAVNFTRIDRRGWVWAGTDAGVAVFDGRFWRRFNANDGLVWNDTMPHAFWSDTDGSVWIGTGGGLTHLKDPEALLQTAPIDLRITRVTLGVNRLDAQSRPLPWEPNLFLNVHWAQLTDGKGSATTLHVRLRGLSDAWFETRSHDVHLPALGPGHYLLEAFAIDSDHRQASALTQFSFEIVPPWWRTFWFQFAVATALVVLIACVMVWRARNRRMQRRDQERQSQEHEALLVRATRDALTGLWNRPAILDILLREIHSSRQHGRPLAVAIIDVDHFKSINDTRGHLAGDEVLRTLGAKLQSRIRSADALGRYGGEEFLLVVPGAAKQCPFLPLERLQRAISEIPFSYAGSPIKITASVGVAWLTGAADTAEKLLSRADEALYSAKHAGRDRVEYAATG
jgi:diguanylate cyclase (GGDEF)-like protein